ncbi:hypothetical protein A2899_00255 [Candidatus Amesbacteria bacterium RIFCSPLOWO2_01_FULL_49_25]|uniref:Uncharacterized protein n=1 Tax=Candidatus Amesbacteria bacterium RIFCSPHIGHO2_01_FULL_48_32b TaxID=1797253 RepID=A0A1F4YH31_9BACT|nr:MAG: hypothetical protein A2876_05000 [Candidatus Amesbacteria bacterium RIFCSPHIGHO2_01_FULL_48_32b]OGD07053.1 MAG: hypothetical protein A2899_00255 [Candidatus Amesbacteria bacterium RIFCSPLOWO2_01_FULL_49_25]
MEFGRGQDGRPQGTSRTESGVIHYTCNAPDENVLIRYGIKPMGRRFGVDEREVLLIPEGLFKKMGIEEVGEVEAEVLLRKLDEDSS